MGQVSPSHSSCQDISWASFYTREELHPKAREAELAFSQEGKSLPTLPSEALKETGAGMPAGPGFRSAQGYGAGTLQP